MQQKLTLKPGIAFWRENDTGVIVDLLRHNQFTCSLGVVDFLEGKVKILSDDVLAFLEENEILVDVNPKEIFEKIIELKKSLPFTGTVYIETTRKCNLKCLGCYNNSGINNHDELTTEKAAEIKKQLRKLGMPHIIITGGEPLILREWYGVISAFSKDFKTTVFSNGTLISMEVAKQLSEAGVHEMKISIDGGCAETHDKLRMVNGSFDRAVNGIKNLVDMKIPVTIQATMSKENISELHSIVELALDLGVNTLRVSPLRSIGRATDTDLMLSNEQLFSLSNELISEAKLNPKLRIEGGESFCDSNQEWRGEIYASEHISATEKQYINFIRSSACDVGIDRFQFNSDSSLQLCPLLSKEFIITANVSEVSNELLYCNETTKILRVPLASQESCNSCGLIYLCGGSCRGNAYMNSNSLNGCDLWQKSYLNYVVRNKDKVGYNVLSDK
jgi:radical SAM protein with 4Fe4S-binding SPASM domain